MSVIAAPLSVVPPAPVALAPIQPAGMTDSDWKEVLAALSMLQDRIVRLEQRMGKSMYLWIIGLKGSTVPIPSDVSGRLYGDPIVAQKDLDAMDRNVSQWREIQRVIVAYLPEVASA